MTTRISGTFLSNTLSSGQDDELTSGTDTSAILSGGELFVDSGASVASATVYAGGLLFLSAGATGSGDVVNGGAETVYGTETGATVFSGGFAVASGGIVNGAAGPNDASGGVALVAGNGASASNSGRVVGGAAGPIVADSAHEQTSGGSAVVENGGASFVNSASILGGAGGAYYGLDNGGHGGAGLVENGGVFTNSGSVAGGVGGFGGVFGGQGGTGVIEFGGVFVNSGTVGAGGGGGSYFNGAGGAGRGVEMYGGTFVNAGSVSGAFAMQFFTGSSTLVVDPGATFSGKVVVDTLFAQVLLELSGTSASTLSGLGTEFTGLTELLVDSGANWTLTSQTTLPATTLVSGVLSSATIYSGDALTVAAGGQVFDTTVLSGGQLTISTGGAGSTDVVSGGSETVYGTETGATLVSGALTVESGGAVLGSSGSDGNYPSPGGSGGAGAIVSGGTLTNSGSVTGGGGGSAAYGGVGAVAVIESGGAIVNLGSVTGGAGGLGGEDGGVGGAGVSETGGTLANSGSIAGGAGGRADEINTGSGGAGVIVSAGTFANSGTVAGGQGGGGGDYVGAVGGAGVIETGGTVTNFGAVTGGGGRADDGDGGAGGAGVSETGGTFVNSGSVTGGAGANGAPFATLYVDGGAGGAGVFLDGGTFVNAASVAGGVGGTAGVRVLSGGGSGTSGAAGDAVQFGGDAPATLVIDPGATFSGLVAADAAVNDVLELGSGSPATLSGLGSQFTGFTTLNVDSGANWTLASETSGGALDTFVYGTLSGATVYAGEALTVEAGGAVVSTTVDSGGTLTILAGGSGSDDLVFGGSETVSGAESSATVEAGGALTVASGGVVSGTLVSASGQLTIGLGGSGFGDAIVGLEILYGTETSATVFAGGEILLRGGVLSGATLSGGLIAIQGGATSGAIVFGGGADELRLTGVLNGTFGATLSGFKVGDTIDLSIGYIPAPTLVYSGGLLTVSGGGESESFVIANATASGFVASNDGHGGTLVTGVADTPPTITPQTPAVVEAGQSTVIAAVQTGAAGAALQLENVSAADGTLSLVSTGSGTYNVVYTANASVPASVIDSVTYTVADTLGFSANGSASVQLDAGPTLAPNAPAEVGHGQTVEIATVAPGLAGDTPSLNQTGGSGTLTISSGGVYYTAPSVVSGGQVDALAYTISDQYNDATVTGRASIALDPGPTAANGALTIGHGQSTPAILSGLVTPGLAGDIETVISLSATSGTATLINGVASYTAPASGTATINYTVADQLGETASGQIAVTVDTGPTLTNKAPTYVAAGVATTVGTTTPGLAGDALSLVTLTAPSHGSLTLSNGNVVYLSSGTVPAGGESDGFKYEIKDQYGDLSSVVSAGVTVDPGPAAKAGAITVGHGQSGLNETAYLAGLFAAGASGDGTAITAVSGATLSSGQVLYTPPASGSPSFSYTVTNSLGQSASNTVVVTVDPGPTLTNKAPTYVAAGVATSVGAATAGLAGDALSLVTLTAPSHGSLTLSNGNLVYLSSGTVPAGGESDSFKYELQDQFGDLSSVVSASVTVDPGPTAKAGAITVGHGQSGLNETAYLAGLFAAGASGDGTVIASVSGATLTGGQVLYTPPASGSPNFSYTVTNSLGQSASNTVVVTVDPGPKAGNVAASVNLGQGINLTNAILAAATAGLKGDTLTITADTTTGTAGGVSLVNGQLVYTASGAGLAHIPANASQSDSFSFTISDSYGDASTGTAKITVSDPADVINGAALGHSTIQGTAGADVINAYSFYNTIYDNGGNDLVNAGSGNATVYTSSGDVVVDLNGFYDIVSGGNGWDTVSGSLGNTTVTLGGGDDSVSTGGYYNTITLGNGADKANAGVGNAVVSLGNGADYVNAGGYSNAITVGSGTDTIIAGAGLDSVTAGAGVETITLAGYSDTVTLNGGTATVSSAQGLETVIANGGHDTLSFAGTGDLAEFFGAVSASLSDMGGGLRIDVSTSAATLALTGFGTTDTSGVIDLLGGAGGYKSAAAIVAAMHSDGHGGTSLSLGSNGSIDFINAGLSSLHASNFQIG